MLFKICSIFSCKYSFKYALYALKYALYDIEYALKYALYDIEYALKYALYNIEYALKYALYDIEYALKYAYCRHRSKKRSVVKRVFMPKKRVNVDLFKGHSGKIETSLF